MRNVTIKSIEAEKKIFEKGFTRQQLAEAASISIITLSKILNGKPCSIKTALKLAAALDTEIENIITYNAE